jgi:Xaa-Pro dipeptidase
MDRMGLDAILVTAPENIFYLTGYHTKAVFTFQPLIFHRTRPAHLVTRQMEIANAETACRQGLLASYSLYQDDDDPIAIATKAIRDIIGAGERTGMELGNWTMPAQRARDIQHACPALAWEDATGVIDRLRLVKSPAELAVMRQASLIGDSIADKAIAAIAPGQSENDISRVVMSEMVMSGSEYPGSWPNVMAGRRTGLIHAAWEGEVVGANDHMLLELTGVKHRYHAPSVRTAFVGEPEPPLRHDAEILTKAHAAAVAAMAPGRPMKVINEAAQAAIAGHELGCTVSRRSGYTLGIGFPPSWGAQWQIGLNSLVEDPLELGMIFHVVLIGHFADGRAIGIGRTVALLSDGPACWTRGGIFDVSHAGSC